MDAVNRGESRNGEGSMPPIAAVLGSIAECRCYACNWPLKAAKDEGCVPFDCSFRPGEHSPERGPWLQRAREMQAVLKWSQSSAWSERRGMISVPESDLRAMLIEKWDGPGNSGHCRRCKAAWINGAKERHKPDCWFATNHNGAKP